VVVAPEDEGVVVAPGGVEHVGRGWRRGSSRVAATVAGVVVAAVVAVALYSGVLDQEVQVERPPFNAKLVGPVADDDSQDQGPSVTGDAWLDQENVMEWWLDHLEPNSRGTVHIDVSKSCDHVGASHWDNEVARNPWRSVVWTSNEWGESFGKLDLNNLLGAYSFASNLGHAIVIYSEDRKVLACGLLQAERDYQNFGVSTNLNNGFIIHRRDEISAGEAIVTRRNRLIWALYNLEANRTGSISVLAGKDCSNTVETWFTTKWQANTFGTSYGEVELGSTEYPFYKIVNQAVAVYNSVGDIVACNSLSQFVEKVPKAVKAVRFELQDIQFTAMSEVDPNFEHPDAEDYPDWPESPDAEDDYLDTDSYTGFYGSNDEADDDVPDAEDPEDPKDPVDTVTAELAPFKGIAARCIDAAIAVHDVQLQLDISSQGLRNEVQREIQTQDANVSQEEIERAIETSAKAEAFSVTISQLFEYKSPATGYLMRNCVTKNCQLSMKELEIITGNLGDTLDALKSRESEFAAAVAASKGGTASQSQEKVAQEYQTLIAQQRQLEGEIADRVETVDTICPEKYSCGPVNALLPSAKCTAQVSCDNKRLKIARRYEDHVAILQQISIHQGAYESAVQKRDAGNPSQDDLEVIRSFDALKVESSAELHRIMTAQSELAVDPKCKAPQGVVTLSHPNIMTWNLTSLQPLQIGTVKIHEGASCDMQALGPVFIEQGLNPFDQAKWETKSDLSAIGHVDLNSFTGSVTFQEYSTRAVVIYNSENDQLACGMFYV